MMLASAASRELRFCPAAAATPLLPLELSSDGRSSNRVTPPSLAAAVIIIYSGRGIARPQSESLRTYLLRPQLSSLLDLLKEEEDLRIDPSPRLCYIPDGRN